MSQTQQPVRFTTRNPSSVRKTGSVGRLRLADFKLNWWRTWKLFAQAGRRLALSRRTIQAVKEVRRTRLRKWQLVVVPSLFDLPPFTTFDGSLLLQLCQINDYGTSTASVVCHDIRDFPRQASTPEFRKRALFSTFSHPCLSPELITSPLTSSWSASANHHEQRDGRAALRPTTRTLGGRLTSAEPA